MLTIALTMRVTEAPDYDEPRDAISHDWIRKLTDWKMSPLLIPNACGDATEYIRQFAPDLLVLTGGQNIGLTPARDQVEFALLNYALNHDLPVLGVCRGMQMINAHLGGSVTDIDGHSAVTHTVQISGEWRGIYDESPSVNSYHGLGIASSGLGSGLEPTARDQDGFIEAFRHQEKSIAGIMWHPEREGTPEADRDLFTRLAEGRLF